MPWSIKPLKLRQGKLGVCILKSKKFLKEMNLKLQSFKKEWGRNQPKKGEPSLYEKRQKQGH